MQLSGVDFIRDLSESGGFSAKMVFNDQGAIFFSTRQEHRDQIAPGISYKDNYEGNALAAMLMPGKIEIRFHREYDDRRIKQLVEKLLAADELSFMRRWAVTYQGRPIP